MNFGSKKFYPIYLTLGNIEKSTRRKADAWILAGYLPVLTGSEAEKKRWSQQNMKGQILHKCLGIFLESLIEPAKRWSFNFQKKKKEKNEAKDEWEGRSLILTFSPCFSGVEIPDPTGKLHRTFPFFCYYMADWPEGKKITLLKDSNKTKLPCHGCMVTNDQLQIINDGIRTLPLKTHAQFQGLYEQASKLSSTQKQVLEKEHSFHAYQVPHFQISRFLASKFPIIFFFSNKNAFWMLAGCNIYFQISPDLIHQFFLGIVKT